ncbi:MAG: hydantoinase/oxoprolinase N-terminal domain-containing protein [Thermoleophilaceae bacterium]
MRLGIDVGGTFTDLVALSGSTLVTAKVPSTPRDQSEGVMAAVEASGVDPAEVVALAHGMTVATNALLERRGARTALVTTAGLPRPARDRPPGSRGALRPDPPAPAGPRAARAVLGGRGADGTGRRGAPAGRGLRRGGGRGAAGGRRRGRRRVPALRVPAPRPRAAGGRAPA